MTDPIERLAAAVERLAVAVEMMLAAQVAAAAMAECARCRGKGWLGRQDLQCHACGGAGRVAA